MRFNFRKTHFDLGRHNRLRKIQPPVDPLRDVPRPKPPAIVSKPMPTCIPGKTSRWCPTCGRKCRIIEYELHGPGNRNAFDASCGNLSHPRELSARRSSLYTWWNRGFIHSFVAPPEPPTFYPWYLTIISATCPICLHQHRIPELEGIRQFGKARRIWNAIRAWFGCIKIIPLKK